MAVFLSKAKNFSPPRIPDLICGPPDLLLVWYLVEGVFLGL
jgi:hypothetical protein